MVGWHPISVAGIGFRSAAIPTLFNGMFQACEFDARNCGNSMFIAALVSAFVPDLVITGQ